jgi:hypothetical protein
MTDLITENARLRAALEAIYEITVEPAETDHKNVRGWIEVTARNALATPAPDAVQEAARVPEIAALIEAAKALHRDMLERAQLKIDTISGDQYRIVNSGRTAWADFDAAIRAIAGDRT